MGLDQGQGQLGDLGDQLFEAAVFLGPLSDLGQQLHRHISGMGFGFDFPGQVMAGMLVASGAAAARKVYRYLSEQPPAAPALT